MLQSSTLHGIYAGLPLPWKRDGSFDDQLYADTIIRLAGYGLQGMYNGGSTGEFFAQDFELFTQTTDVLIESLRNTDVYTQIGVAGLTTDEIIKRGEYAIKKGADALQIAFPFWYEVTDEEAVGLYADLGKAFQGFPLIHYDSGRSKHKLTRKLLGRIKEVYPQVIGVKCTAINVKQLRNMVQDFPDVRFFAATDWLVTLYRDVGVSGSYDVLVYMNPPLVLNMYELCRQGNFAEAMPLQEKLQHFYRIVEELGFLQYSDSAIDRCIGLSTGFLKGYTQAVKKPYSTVPEHMLDTLKARVANELPELLEY